jgi:hypothetical protein
MITQARAAIEREAKRPHVLFGRIIEAPDLAIGKSDTNSEAVNVALLSSAFGAFALPWRPALRSEDAQN